jgi:hypothetical protein
MLRETIKAAYIASSYLAYPPSDLDPVYKKYQGKEFSEIRNKENKNLLLKKFNTQNFLIATSFLGLPNTLFKNGANSYKELSWLDVGKNLLGWTNNTHIALNIIKAPFFFSFHAFLILPTLVKNIAKFATEFLPEFASILCYIAADSIKDKCGIGDTFLYGLAKFGQFTFESLSFIGRAITSPITGSRKAWKIGADLISKDKYPIASTILSGTLFALSIGITATICALTFPLAINAISAMIASHAPVIAHAITSAIQFLSPISSISNFPTLVSAGIITGVSIPVVGAAVNQFCNFITTRKPKSTIKAKEETVITTVDENNSDDSKKKNGSYEIINKGGVALSSTHTDTEDTFPLKTRTNSQPTHTTYSIIPYRSTASFSRNNN